MNWREWKGKASASLVTLFRRNELIACLAIALLVVSASYALGDRRGEFPERRDAPAPPVINPKK